jgi:hypothetical protein
VKASRTNKYTKGILALLVFTLLNQAAAQDALCTNQIGEPAENMDAATVTLIQKIEKIAGGDLLAAQWSSASRKGQLVEGGPMDADLGRTSIELTNWDDGSGLLVRITELDVETLDKLALANGLMECKAWIPFTNICMLTPAGTPEDARNLVRDVVSSGGLEFSATVCLAADEKSATINLVGVEGSNVQGMSGSIVVTSNQPKPGIHLNGIIKHDNPQPKDQPIPIEDTDFFQGGAAAAAE